MLSLGSLVGFVTVLGIAARNGIMLVSHYRHLEEEEGEPFGPELVIRGSIERLAPILMTALATGLALVPLAFGGDKPGQEIEHPMAVVILGGLVTSTVLNLFLMPALYLPSATGGGWSRSEAVGRADAPHLNLIARPRESVGTRSTLRGAIIGRSSRAGRRRTARAMRPGHARLTWGDLCVIFSKILDGCHEL